MAKKGSGKQSSRKRAGGKGGASVSDLLSNFGSRVRQIRKARGWTQEELARRAEVGWKYLGTVERGERNLTLKNIERIARALGVDIGQLFLFPGEEGSPPPELDVNRLTGALASADPATRSFLLHIYRAFLAWRGP